MDTVYGYRSVNVEAQQRSSPSLLNWMRRMIQVRKTHSAFGRGDLRLLYPRNRRFWPSSASTRIRVYCACSILRDPRKRWSWTLSEFNGTVPVELMGSSAFPPIGQLPYMLTLPGYGFYWFVLATEAQQPLWHIAPPEPAPDFITIVASSALVSALSGRERSHLERDALPGFLQRQRWFGAKNTEIARYHDQSSRGDRGRGRPSVPARAGRGCARRRNRPAIFHSAVRQLWGSEHLRPGAPQLSFTIAKVRRGARVGALLDAVHDEAFRARAGTHHDRRQEPGGGRRRTAARCSVASSSRSARKRRFCPPAPSRRNVSFIVDDRIMLKVYRRLRSGIQPELEVARFLTEVAGYQNTPAFLGALDYVKSGAETLSIAAALRLCPQSGRCVAGRRRALDRALDVVALNPDDDLSEAAHLYVFPIDIAARLGQRTAELHRAFATPTDDPAFRPEPIGADDMFRWSAATPSRGRERIRRSRLRKRHASRRLGPADRAAFLPAARVSSNTSTRSPC